MSGVAARAPRPPTATQIVYQYLGDSLDLRKTMKLCALYDPDDPQIPAEVRRMLAMGIREEARLLEAPVT